jgi:hypothetical protein
VPPGATNQSVAPATGASIKSDKAHVTLTTAALNMSEAPGETARIQREWRERVALARLRFRSGALAATVVPVDVE